MILETMTREEVFKEIKQDEDWLKGMGYGLMKKYSKQLKDKRYGHREILGMSSYTTPNNNRVHCVHQKYYSDKDNKYASVCFVSLYEYRCGDKLRYIYPIYGYGVFENCPCGLVVFTEHCQQIGKSVSIVSISIDPFGPYFEEDKDGKMIKGSDFERCVINWSEWGNDFGTNCHTGFFSWMCESEELIFEFEMEDEGMSDFYSYNWAKLQEDMED